MRKPHKHAEVIKAWADGCAIQIQKGDGSWFDFDEEYVPVWSKFSEYRIKPESKPDVVRPMYIYSMKESETTVWTTPNCNRSANVNVIFDGETGNLKDVEIIK